MSIIDDLSSKSYGSFTYLQWILIFVAFFLLVFVVLWIQGEMSKEPPEVVEGIADGVFHGKRYGWYASAPISITYKDQGCYNSSYVYFWGNITYSDGTTADYSIEGRKIEGLICKQTVDSYIWQSSDKSERTPITLWFKGTVTPMPVLDITPYIPWILTLVFAGTTAWALWWRKIRRKKFDATSAKRLFENYIKDEGMRGISKIEAEPSGIGNTYVVGQQVDLANGRPYLITTVDSSGSFGKMRYDDSGDVWRTTFGKEGLEFNQKMQMGRARYTEEDMYDTASKLVEDMKRRKAKIPTNEHEKRQETQRLMSEESESRPAFSPRPDEE